MLKIFDFGWIFHQFSIPDLEETVPRSGTHCHAILGHAQTAHSVVMTGEHTCSLGADRVPNVAVVVVVAGDQQSTGPTEGHRGDAANDVVVVVHRQLLIAADVEETTRGVV